MLFPDTAQVEKRPLRKRLMFVDACLGGANRPEYMKPSELGRW